MLTREFMQAYYRTYNSEDPDALSAYYADAAVLASAAGETSGACAILDTYRFLIEHFHDKMTPGTISIDGNQATVEIVDNFTAKKPVEDFLGRRFKTGDTLTLNLLGTYTISNGQFTFINIEQLK